MRKCNLPGLTVTLVLLLGCKSKSRVAQESEWAMLPVAAPTETYQASQFVQRQPDSETVGLVVLAVRPLSPPLYVMDIGISGTQTEAVAVDNELAYWIWNAPRDVRLCDAHGQRQATSWGPPSQLSPGVRALNRPPTSDRIRSSGDYVWIVRPCRIEVSGGELSGNISARLTAELVNEVERVVGIRTKVFE